MCIEDESILNIDQQVIDVINHFNRNDLFLENLRELYLLVIFNSTSYEI